MGRHAAIEVAAERADGQVAMPADRLFHARLGHSAKVSSLSDLAYRVWTTYLLGADDFGVMRADAVAFQAAHDALRERPAAEVAAGIERLVEVGLVAAFIHQGARYLYQSDWQDFQRVRFPGRTLHPLPAEAMVSARTRHLWSTHPGGTRLPAPPRDAAATSEQRQKFSRSSSAPLQNNFRTTSEELPSHARACETANGLRLKASEREGGAGGEGAPGGAASDVASRAAALVERYRAELYPRHRGVAYAPTRAVEASDADAAERLCAAWDDAALARLAERFLTTEGDRFLDGRTRTLSMLLSRAPALAEQLRRPEDKQRDGVARSTEPREAYDAVIERAES